LNRGAPSGSCEPACLWAAVCRLQRLACNAVDDLTPRPYHPGGDGTTLIVSREAYRKMFPVDARVRPTTVVASEIGAP